MGPGDVVSDPIEDNDAGVPRLGYIGLGSMGAPMAMRLVDWPGGLTVYDVRADAMTPFAAAGAPAAVSDSAGLALTPGATNAGRH